MFRNLIILLMVLPVLAAAGLCFAADHAPAINAELVMGFEVPRGEAVEVAMNTSNEQMKNEQMNNE